MKSDPPARISLRVPMHTTKFWPIDYDPEGEIYDNPAWDLPGFRHRRHDLSRNPARPARKMDDNQV